MILTKAVIVNLDTGESIRVMFNPPEYQLQKTNQFAEVGIPGLGSSLLQFVKGSAQTLAMELFFDTSDQGTDVRSRTSAVIALMDVNSETHAPPRLLFLWGSLAFPCVLENVSQKFDYFNPAGLPLRARLSVALKGNNLLKDLLGEAQLQSPDRSKVRLIRAGDTLQGIAAQEYDDPRLWREVAQANGIDNPLAVPVGRSLKVPALT
jgi:nucleoid-associated protein YgaU